MAGELLKDFTWTTNQIQSKDERLGYCCQVTMHWGASDSSMAAMQWNKWHWSNDNKFWWSNRHRRDCSCLRTSITNFRVSEPSHIGYPQRLINFVFKAGLRLRPTSSKWTGRKFWTFNKLHLGTLVFWRTWKQVIWINLAQQSCDAEKAMW